MSSGLWVPGRSQQSLVPSAWSSRLALAWGQPRAPGACRSSLGTAGDPRADAQTDRRRGAGRSPAAPESANQRRGGRTPLTLSPCFAGPLCSEAPESQLTWPPSPSWSWGPSLGHWSVFLPPSLRFKARDFHPPRTRKIVCRIAYLNASSHPHPCFFFSMMRRKSILLSASQWDSDPQKLRTILPIKSSKSYSGCKVEHYRFCVLLYIPSKSVYC